MQRTKNIERSSTSCCLIGVAFKYFPVLVHMVQLLLSPISHKMGLYLYFGLYIFLFKYFVDIQYYIKQQITGNYKEFSLANNLNVLTGMYVVI